MFEKQKVLLFLKSWTENNICENIDNYIDCSNKERR